MRISGLDKLQKNLKDAEKALAELDGDLGSVSFDPSDPNSIEMAIQEVARIIDDRVGENASNPIVGPIADQMKSIYRDRILQKAAVLRLGIESPDDN